MRAFQLVTIGALMNFFMTSAVFADQNKLEKKQGDIYAAKEEGLGEAEMSAEMEEEAQLLEDAGKECCQKSSEEVKLDDAQKAQIKAAIEAFKADAKVLKAQVKESFEALAATIKDPNSTLAAAQAAAENLETAKMQLHGEVVSLKLNILYNILTPQQRPMVFSCMLMKHAHKLRHGSQAQRPGAQHHVPPAKQLPPTP